MTKTALTCGAANHFFLGNVTMVPHTQYRRGFMLVTASALIWSTAGFFTRIINTDAPAMLLWRGIFGSLGFFGYMPLEKGSRAFGPLARLGPHGLLYALIGAAAMQMLIASSGRLASRISRSSMR